MNRSGKNYLSKLEVFFKENIKTSKEIFDALKTLFDFDEGFVYFLTPDRLRLEYSYQSKAPHKEILITEAEKSILFNADKPIDKSIFGSEFPNILAGRLVIENTVYGILFISSRKKFSKEDEEIFQFVNLIVSNVIKNIQLTEIIKMQTETLQKSLVDTDKALKVIRKQNQKIIASDKVKNKFLANVSHELRTPLNSIIGFSELLQNPKLGKLNKVQSEYIKDIQTAGITLLGMINEILDISKLESHSMKMNLQTFDVYNVIFETLNILKPLYERKNLELKLDLDHIQITADYQKLQQILFNLINNAIKFTPSDGFIEISTAKRRKYIELRVKDNGCGIDKQYHKRVFQKFEQINATENSTGLGLTITKELVNLHNGKIKVESEKGKGAEFIVILPISTV